MKAPEYYAGREQTYLKHYFLERYLEHVAYHIGYSNNDFVYVDCFSGPWKSTDEKFEDTSFMIALQELRKVREGLGAHGRYPRIRCLFIEKDLMAFRELERATQGLPRVEVQAIHGEFEQVIPEILRFIGQSFALIFIDPTGMTGFGLDQIRSLLQHRPGEVIVNFMFDFINRFPTHPNPQITARYNQLFGGPGWEDAIRQSPHRERTIIELYCERLRAAGNFPHVTYTRIVKPSAERTYFYLVYGTRHVRGLQKFREVEHKFVDEQERVRLTAKQQARIERTHQNELFAATDEPLIEPSFAEERQNQKNLAQARLWALFNITPRVEYDDVLKSLLELPLVWESDIKEMVTSLHAQGEIQIEGLKPRERTPKSGHILLKT